MTKSHLSPHPALSAALALVFSFAMAGCTNARPANERPRTDLPAFDAKKAEHLSTQKRAALEKELFSELSLWNRGSVKYPTKADIDRREQRWLEMANEGFELAYITLQVLEPSKGRVHELQRPMKRLEQLAEQGDAGAMCLMTGLAIQASERFQIDAYRPAYRRWLERGAALSHPECLGTLGSRFLHGSGGYKKNVTRGLSLTFDAIKRGYIHDLGALSRHYEGKGFTDVQNVKRLYCWLSIEAKSTGENPKDYLVQSIRENAPDLLSSRQDLLNELQSWAPEPQDCMSLGTGETQ